jgi:putative membrane protein
MGTSRQSTASPGRAAVAGLATLSAPGAALAHGTELDWHVAPSDSLLVLLPLLAVAGLYLAGVLRRAASPGLQPRDGARSAAFSCAILLLAAALVWPLDAWAGLSFAAHMGQHMVLLALAPPLLLLGRPGAVILRGLPRAAQGWVLQPRRWPGSGALRRLAASAALAGVLHGVLLWGWHVPAMFELALRSELVHWLEHVTLLASGMLFWRALLRARGPALGWGLVSMLVTVIHSGLLGALLTLAPQPLYGTYARQAGAAAALADQQLAGLIMWVPMGMVYLLAAIALAARVIGPDPRPAREAAS